MCNAFGQLYRIEHYVIHLNFAGQVSDQPRLVHYRHNICRFFSVSGRPNSNYYLNTPDRCTFVLFPPLKLIEAGVELLTFCPRPKADRLHARMVD